MLLEGHAKVDVKWVCDIGEYKEKETHDNEVEKLLTDMFNKITKDNNNELTFKITKVKNKLKKQKENN